MGEKKKRLWQRKIDQAADAAITHRDFQVQPEIKLDDKYLFIFIPNMLYLCTFFLYGSRSNKCRRRKNRISFTSNSTKVHSNSSKL